MKNYEPIKIPLNKTKLVFLFVAALLFVAIGAFLISTASSEISKFSLISLWVAGLLSIVFFGALGLFILWKIFDSKPGLIISKEGIYDNSSAISLGFIPWSDIEDIDEITVSGQRFIHLKLRNTQEYLNKQKNWMKKMTLRTNYKFYKMLVGISVNGLQYEHDQLKLLIEKKYDASRGIG